MKKKCLVGLATCILITGVITVANAAVIDFNTSPDNYYWHTPVYSGGFMFSDITGDGSLGTASNLDHRSVDNGTVHLMDWDNGYSNLSSLKMEASDSSLFDLNMFDFTSGYLRGSSKATQLSVSGFDSFGNLIANSIFMAGEYSHLSFMTLNLDNSFQNLSYVIFDATGRHNRVGYDNIVVNEAAPVPEPTTMLLFGTGLLGLVSYNRKRSQ